MERKQKAVSRGLRYDAELDKRVEAATKKGGFSSPSAFMREAIERELAGRESGVDPAEQRIAACLDRKAREIRNLRMCTTKPSLSARCPMTGFSKALAWQWWAILKPPWRSC
jgi:Arc/MetJ-type ribon-helix-helix transcriptional regulator